MALDAKLHCAMAPRTAPAGVSSFGESILHYRERCLAMRNGPDIYYDWGHTCKAKITHQGANLPGDVKVELGHCSSP
jgi:hypothetical protein